MNEPPDEEALRALLNALLGALEAFHHAGGCHGKVTPSNILLLADNRPLLQSTVTYREGVQQPLVDQKDQLNDILVRLPTAFNIIGRAGGVYGDFFNFYACDISVKLSGRQPGGPGRFEVPSWDQASQKKVRDALLSLAKTLPDTKRTFGPRDQVDPVRHLIGTAFAFGGNPRERCALPQHHPEQERWCDGPPSHREGRSG